MEVDRLLRSEKTDHAAWLWITTVIAIILAACVAVYRVVQRWRVWTRECWDDHVAFLTFVWTLHIQRLM